MPLHYGASVTKSGAVVGSYGVRTKTKIQIERLVQIDLASLNSLNLTLQDIGRVLGCSARYVQTLRNHPAYIMLRMEMTTGISARAEDSAKNFVALRKQAMVDMLPAALRTIAEAISSPSTPIAVRVKVAQDVIDREGSFPKVSRSEIRARVEHDYAASDGVSAELLSYMTHSSSEDEVDPLILKALAANRAFSSSDTISSAQQEKAMKMLELIPEEGNTIQ
jgi:hypothetical protein